jgi:hypothetical protein
MITRVVLDQQAVEPSGLTPTVLRDLGPVVVLAGPNGEGKSRYLKVVHDRAAVAARQPKGALDAMRQQLETVRRVPAMASSTAGLEKQLSESVALHNSISFGGKAAPPLWLDPSDVVLRSPRVDVDLHFPNSRTNLLLQISKRRQELLTSHAKAIFNARHVDFAEDAEVQALGRVASDLSSLLESVLGTPLTVGVVKREPLPKLFGRLYAEQELSTGQHLLLVWALLLHAKEDQLPKGSIAFVDEPERQLHPKAAIELLERLQGAVGPDGQLWIATHSPSIVAAFGQRSLYRVARNAISYAGTRVDQVMDGLLGGAQGRRAFAEQLIEADQLNFFRYASEALFPATVAAHQVGDRQETQFAHIITRACATKGAKLRILDYAAGKGRFAVALADAVPADIRARLEYFAFNDAEHNSHAGECCRNVATLHPDDATSRCSSEVSDFFGQARVDLVVMANFLHEIEPAAWGRHFSLAAKALADDGVLVIMEDQEPPVGELPTEHGFILLDLTALRILFGQSIEVRPLLEPGRLTAFEVPQKLLQSFDDRHLRDALVETRDRAKLALQRLRKGETADSPQAQGRRHAFLALLYTTAQLTLDSMPVSSDAMRKPDAAQASGRSPRKGASKKGR